jgi:hypothetical protein
MIKATYVPDPIQSIETTPLLDSSPGISNRAANDDHTHRSPGGLVSLEDTKTISNYSIETQIMGVSLPANFITTGTTFCILATGTLKSANTAPTVTWKIRIGSSSLSGYIITSVSPIINRNLSGKLWNLQVLVTARDYGTVVGSGIIQGEYSTTLTQALKGCLPNPVSSPINFSIPLLLELTFQFGTAHPSNTLICYNSTIEVIKM